MLVARREPPFHADPHNPGPVNPGVYSAAKASRLTRFVTAIQLVGSLLAVPIGIASAYSFYRANFSPDTTCQNLRSGIIAMLDKSVDAATRRILVRRDVEAFEKSCGTVDPDATAAFKTLLEVEKVAAPAKAPTAVATTPTAPKVQHVETLAKEPVRKVEPRPQPVAKQPTASPSTSVATVEAEPVHRDPAVSDAQWLDAVRQALVTHKQEIHPPELAKAPPATEPAAKPMPHEAALPATPAAAPPAPAAAISRAGRDTSAARGTRTTGAHFNCAARAGATGRRRSPCAAGSHSRFRAASRKGRSRQARRAWPISRQEVDFGNSAAGFSGRKRPAIADQAGCHSATVAMSASACQRPALSGRRAA